MKAPLFTLSIILSVTPALSQDAGSDYINAARQGAEMQAAAEEACFEQIGDLRKASGKTMEGVIFGFKKGRSEVLVSDGKNVAWVKMDYFDRKTAERLKGIKTQPPPSRKSVEPAPKAGAENQSYGWTFGWNKVRWGMKEADIRAAYPDCFSAKPSGPYGHQKGLKLFSGLRLRDFDINGGKYDVLFLMDGEALKGVRLERKAASPLSTEGAHLAKLLTDKYGEPTESIDREDSMRRTWTVPGTTIDLYYAASDTLSEYLLAVDYTKATNSKSTDKL